MIATVPTLTPRPLADSVDDLLAGAVRLGGYSTNEVRSSAIFEHVEIDGERCIVKYVDVDHDFTMRVSGDLGCRPRRIWQAGLMDVAPDAIDHATLGAAPWGRNGWGVALLMRDVAADLVPAGDDPISPDDHQRFLDGMAAMAASTWGWHDDLDLLEHRLRWEWFGPAQLDGERALGFPERVPELALEGWQRFEARVPGRVGRLIDELRRDTDVLSRAVLSTPQTFLHGDWKLGNLGVGRDGRTILLDWAYPGEGPPCHELAWYLALNRARLPIGHTKESTIEGFRAALGRRGVATDAWFDRQLGLCLLGALVQFGWEKAYGDDAELNWWCDAALDGARWL